MGGFGGCVGGSRGQWWERPRRVPSVQGAGHVLRGVAKHGARARACRGIGGPEVLPSRWTAEMSVYKTTDEGLQDH